MRIAHFFIDRPRFATVVSAFLTLIGLGAMFVLPVAQYPEIVPPTVQVTTSYPGASADTIARTVATPLEQQINGVENMLYMSSQSTGNGQLTVTVTFRIGTDLNVAQMLTQNRVQDALPRLPEDVQRLGVQVRKSTPSILLAVHLYSPNHSHDTLYLSNYATLHVKDTLARLQGVGDVQIQGAREYAMRIWIDPDRAAAHDPDRQRDIGRAARAERAGLGRDPEPAAGGARRGLPDQRRGAGPAGHARAVRRHRAEVGPAGAGHAPARYRARRGGRGRLRRDLVQGPRRRHRDADLRRARRELAGRRARGAGGHGRAQEGVPGRRRLPDHLRPDHLHRQVGGRGDHHHLRGDPAGGGRGVRVPAETGAPPSFRWWRSRSRCWAPSSCWPPSASR